MLLFVRDSDDREELEESSGYTVVVMLWEPYNHSDKYFFQVKSNSNCHLSRKPWFTQISQCDGGASMIFSVGAGGYLNPQWVTQGQMQCFVYSSVASCVTVASSTIINSRVFTRQAAHVQIHLVHVVVSGNCEAILDRCWIIFTAAWRSRNVGKPLQAFSFSLSDPADISRAIRYPCICTRQFVGFSGPLHRRFRFSQSLTANTWGENQFGYRTETNMSLDDKDEECRGLEFTRNGRQQQNCETFS